MKPDRDDNVRYNIQQPGNRKIYEARYFLREALHNSLQPRGVAVFIDAEHQCMTTRGIHKPGTTTVTTAMIGEFKKNSELESKFLQMIK